jgi:Flp pilus assembly pilin Flp
MRYGIIKAVCLVVLACITVVSAFGDEVTVDFTSIVLENFSNETSHEWNEGRRVRTFDFTWKMAASKFASKSTDDDGNEVNYPLMAYVDAWPVALFGYNREGKDIKSLGIHGRFDRRGYNWIDLYPVETDGTTPFEIPMPGRIQYMDLWIWGSNLDFTVEAFVRDHNGAVHTISLGSLAFGGWKNMRANIPRHIQQSKRVLPNFAQLRFVKFRIWTMPKERVDNFYIYIKQFKVLSDTFESNFDGDELADPDQIPQLWANSRDNSN